MRALLLALLPIVLVLAACEKADRRPPDPDPTRAATNTATKTAGTGETPDADPAGGVEPGPEAEPEKPASAAGPEPEEEASRDGELIARRRYEQLVNGQRAGVIDVTWRWDTWNGERVVKDTTRFVTRTARMMGQVRDVFESKTTSELWRRPTGELVRLLGAAEQHDLAPATLLDLQAHLHLVGQHPQGAGGVVVGQHRELVVAVEVLDHLERGEEQLFDDGLGRGVRRKALIDDGP